MNVPEKVAALEALLVRVKSNAALPRATSRSLGPSLHDAPPGALQSAIAADDGAKAAVADAQAPVPKRATKPATRSFGDPSEDGNDEVTTVAGTSPLTPRMLAAAQARAAELEKKPDARRVRTIDTAAAGPLLHADIAKVAPPDEEMGFEIPSDSGWGFEPAPKKAAPSAVEIEALAALDALDAPLRLSPIPDAPRAKVEAAAPAKIEAAAPAKIRAAAPAKIEATAPAKIDAVTPPAPAVEPLAAADHSPIPRASTPKAPPVAPITAKPVTKPSSQLTGPPLAPRRTPKKTLVGVGLTADGKFEPLPGRESAEPPARASSPGDAPQGTPPAAEVVTPAASADETPLPGVDVIAAKPALPPAIAAAAEPAPPPPPVAVVVPSPPPAALAPKVEDAPELSGAIELIPEISAAFELEPEIAAAVDDASEVDVAKADAAPKIAIAGVPVPARPVPPAQAAEAVTASDVVPGSARPAAMKDVHPRASIPPPAGSPWKWVVIVAVIVGPTVFLALRAGLFGTDAPLPPAPTATTTAKPQAPVKATPTADPTAAPTTGASAAPTAAPTTEASAAPSTEASAAPSAEASAAPSAEASAAPTAALTAVPSAPPTAAPVGDLAALPPNTGYLTVTSPSDASVFVNGVLVGRTNVPLVATCGAKFLRLAAPLEPGSTVTPTWISGGKSLMVACKAQTTFAMSPE